jgi:hypothetical protein
MACDKTSTMTFRVYELYPNGKEADEGKIFTISKEENDEYLTKLNWRHSVDQIDDTGIILAIFNKLYTFSIGPNGFTIVWDKDQYGTPQRYTSGYLYWPGPRKPAIQCFGNVWRIVRQT